MKNLTIKKARELLDSKELTAVELANYYLQNIEAKNKELNAYLEVYDDVLTQAKEAQEIIDKGESKNLTGIPIAIKDNILIKGKIASGASKILQNYRAVYDATVISKLKSEGVIFLGRTNMDEFAMGGSTENSAFGVSKNPYDTSRVAGGSSGGSAVAVSADMALASLGSDTGGSVREPSAFCGTVGLKPTYGSVSRYGLMAMGSSLDCIGPISKSVEDTEIIFNCIKGRDIMDATSIDQESNAKNKKPKIIGVPYHILNQGGISESVKNNFDESINKLKNLGYEIVDITLPNVDKSLAIYYIIMPAEVSSNMARYDGMRYGLSENGNDLLSVYKNTKAVGFGPEVKRRIILGTFVLSSGYYDAYYAKAMFARNLLIKEFNDAFQKIDAILTPTTPFPAWKIGEKKSPLENYLADVFTVTANIVGVPAISIPSGFANIDGKKLPLGIQLTASHSQESILFGIGKHFLGE